MKQKITHTLLLFLALSLQSIGQTSLFWIDDNGLYRNQIEENITEKILPNYNPLAIEINEAKQVLYFASDLGIHQIKLDGSELKTLYTTNDANAHINDLFFDADNAQLYWSEKNEIAQIKRMNEDGTDTQIIVALPDAYIGDIIVNPQTENIFWLGAEKIHKANLNGTSIETIVDITGQGMFGGLAINQTEGKIYWAQNHLMAQIKSMDFEGNNTILHNEQQGSILDLVCDENEQTLYFINKSNSACQIHKIASNGLSETDLSETNPSEANLGTIVWEGEINASTKIGINTQQNELFWSNPLDKQIHRFQLNASTKDILFSANFSKETTLSINPLTQEIYWFDFAHNKMYHTSNSGNGFESITFKGYLPKPNSLIWDWEAEKIYWIRNETGQLYQSNFDGSEASAIINESPLLSFGIDFENKQLYCLSPSEIIRTDLNGVNPTSFLPGNFTSNDQILFNPNDGNIYWTQSQQTINPNMEIKRANKEGQMQEIIKVVDYPDRVSGFSIDAQNEKIYWSNQLNLPQIHRMNFDGTEEETVLSNEHFNFFKTFQVVDGPLEVVSIPTIEQSLVKIHPNPVTEYLYIENHTNYHKAYLYEANGKLVQTVQVNQQNHIDCTNWESGVYILVLQGEGNKRFSIPILKH